MAVEGHALAKFKEMCQKYPDKPAVIYLGEKFSYLKLKELSDRFATALNELGVRENDKVFLYFPNCIQWVIAFLGILEIGAVAVPVSPIYTPTEIAYLINDSGAETIICQDTNFGYVKEILPRTNLKRIIFTNLVDLLPFYKRAIGLLFDKVPRGKVEKGKNIYSFKDLIFKYPPNPLRAQIKAKENFAYILYTGGTTGMPKGVPGTHATILYSINDFHNMSEGYIEEEKSTLVLVNPLFHIMAMMTFLSLGLSLGNTTVLMPSAQTDAILDAIQRYKGDLFLGVPTLYRMILENDRLNFYNLKSLKYCWSGGDVLPVEVLKRWRQRFDVPIYQSYGTTEASYTTFSSLDKEPKPGSVGLPTPSKKIKIVDPDNFEIVPLNSPGELLVASDGMVGYYWNKPEETKTSFVELDGKRYYRTKDIVRMDEEGELYYVDRGADIIKHKGYRVSCSEIEAILQNHPAVIGACVVGVPDPKVGERIKGIVVLKEDARGVGATDLIKWCRESLASYKIPDYIEFRDMLPKSKVGKLLRREVREEERQRMKKT